jgi:hypothetical protein
MTKVKNLVLEYEILMEMPRFPGQKVPICGLCGNTGKIRHEVPPPPAYQGVPTGRIFEAFCLCPNGRKDKRRHDKAQAKLRAQAALRKATLQYEQDRESFMQDDWD